MSEFYSIIQLLATLAIGFAILDYSEFIIGNLTKRFYYVYDLLEQTVKECQTVMPDNLSLNTLTSVAIGNGDTSGQIEMLKINYEKINREIQNFKNESYRQLERINKPRCLTSTSLFVFMAMVALLFVPSLKQQYGEVVILFLLSFSGLCIVYLVLGWFLGERENNKWPFRYESIKHPIICFTIICTVSAAFSIIALWQSLYIGELWKYLFVALIIVGWLNFVIYFFIIERTIRDFINFVMERRKSLLDECMSLMSECNKLMAIMDMANLVIKH